MRASTAHSALLVAATLVALAAAGCNGYMLYHVQRAFAAAPKPGTRPPAPADADYDLVRWRALLIAAEAVCGAAALYALAHALVRRANAYSPLVAVRVDVLALSLLGGGAAAIGILLFLSFVPGAPHRLYSLVHCSALGTRCRIHYAGAAALLLAALLLIVSAVFEGVYASLHPGGWGESVHALAAELGGDAPKMKKRKSHLSISEPFHPREKDSTDGAPLMHAPAPCATLPLTYNGYGMELDPLDFRPTPAVPQVAERGECLDARDHAALRPRPGVRHARAAHVLPLPRAVAHALPERRHLRAQGEQGLEPVLDHNREPVPHAVARLARSPRGQPVPLAVAALEHTRLAPRKPVQAPPAARRRGAPQAQHGAD
jgi:hypothetical protein